MCFFIYWKLPEIGKNIVTLFGRQINPLEVVCSGAWNWFLLFHDGVCLNTIGNSTTNYYFFIHGMIFIRTWKVPFSPQSFHQKWAKCHFLSSFGYRWNIGKLFSLKLAGRSVGPWWRNDFFGWMGKFLSHAERTWPLRSGWRYMIDKIWNPR